MHAALVSNATLLRAELRARLGACVLVVDGLRVASPVGVAGLWTLFEPQSDQIHAAYRAAADGHVAGKEAETCVKHHHGCCVGLFKGS